MNQRSYRLSANGHPVPAQEPEIAVNDLDDDYNGEYILFMVDPDARYPEDPQLRFIVHWWQAGLTKSSTAGNSTSDEGTALVNTTAPMVSYHRPQPPPDSAAHRYIQYLFEQPDDYMVPAAYSGYNDQNITNFPFEQLIADAGLGEPVAANYFYASNQTAVPDTFIGSPGSEYPGGNGAMITQGTNEPSATSGSSSASATGTATETEMTAPATYTGAAGTLRSDKTLTGVFLATGAFLALR